MNSLIIPIIQKNKIATFFIKSSRYLFNKYDDFFKDNENYDLKLKLLADFYCKEFNANLIIIDQTPRAIKFSNTSSMTLFFIRFGD